MCRVKLILGDPKRLKFKLHHIEALKRIQNKYKISRLGPEITRHLNYMYLNTVFGEFSFKSVEDIIKE